MTPDQELNAFLGFVIITVLMLVCWGFVAHALDKLDEVLRILKTPHVNTERDDAMEYLRSMSQMLPDVPGEGNLLAVKIMRLIRERDALADQCKVFANRLVDLELEKMLPKEDNEA